MNAHRHCWFRSAALRVVLVSLAALAGCGYKGKTDAFLKPYEVGQFELAAKGANELIGPVKSDTKNPDELLKVDRRDAIVFRLEQGAVLRANDQLDESVLAFRHADDLIHEQDQKPDVQVSREVGAAVTNLTYLDYKGYSYDRLALQLFLALDYLQQGQFDNARTALRAMQQRQDEAEEHFKKKLEAIEDKNAKNDDASKEKVDVERTRQDPKFSESLKTAYGDVPTTPDRTAYRAYSNPFGEYIQGIYFMAAALNGSDAETAAVAFKRVNGMLPDNDYVKQDLAVAEKVASGGAVPPTTYVLFETGLAPYREQIRIDIPVFVVNLAYKDTGVDYVGAAFPKLKFRDGHVPYINIVADGQTYKTTVMTDMDEVIKQDFNNELPLVITRTIIATATKAAIAYAANRASSGNGYANIVTRVGTTLYQAGMNQADLRTWETLPKQLQAARIPTPKDRQIALILPNGASLPPVALQDGVVNIVYVKSVQAGQAPLVQQFKLK